MCPFKWVISLNVLVYSLLKETQVFNSIVISNSLMSAGFQCGLPESGSEGWAGRGSETAGVQPNWQHHLLSLPVHHQRPVWVWQAHVHCSARLPGREGKPVSSSAWFVLRTSSPLTQLLLRPAALFGSNQVERKCGLCRKYNISKSFLFVVSLDPADE